MEKRFRRFRCRARAWLRVAIVASLAVGLAPAVTASADPKPPDAGAVRATCPWVASRAPVAARVAQLMARMSLADKLALVHGIAAPNPYAGVVAGNPALCIPRLTLHDGPIGVRMDGTTQLPSATDLAASFDPALARQYGQVIGAEDRTKGIDVDLGPTINIVRDPRWGRAFETYSEDPYLAGQIAAGTVEGIQSQGVMSQVKHWAVYNQEDHRNTPADDVEVSERAIHELYARAFDMVIQQADPSSVMCSYAWINGVDACENAQLDHVLRDELHFTGFITSDWGGTHSTVAAANAGLDMEMPGDAYFGAALAKAIQAGKVSPQRLDAMVSSILTEEFRFGLFDRGAPGSAAAAASTAAHRAVALKAAEDGAVLLKNAGDVLPLTDAEHTIAVIGTGAGFDTLTHGGGSASVPGTHTVTPLAGIRERAAAAGAEVRYAPGPIPDDGAYPTITSAHFETLGGARGLRAAYFANARFAGAPAAERTEPDVAAIWRGAPADGVKAGSAFSVRWTGKLTPSVSGTYTFGLTANGGVRLRVDGKPVIDALADARAAVPADQTASARIVSGLPIDLGTTRTGTVQLTAGKPVSIEVDYAFEPPTGQSEWWMGMGTRHLADAFVNLGWLLPNEPATIAAAARAAAHADVAIVYANKFTSEAFDESDLTLPGDQDQLIAAVAAANPRTIVVLNTGSAVTMPWLGKAAAVIEAWYPGQESGNAIAALLYGDVAPSGKLPVTFPASLGQVPAATPAEWGGVGGRIRYAENLDVGYRWYDARKLKPLFPFGYGLGYTTFAFSQLAVAAASGGGAVATVEVANTGKRDGADVAQLYVGFPAGAGEPPLQLRGFQKVSLKPGESRRVSFTLTPSDFAIWDTATHAWRVPGGTFRIMVGDSSADLPLRATLPMAARPLAGTATPSPPSP